MTTHLLGVDYIVDDLDVVDPWNPFWIGTMVTATVDGVEQAPVPLTATLRGTVDDTPWLAVVRSGTVKVGRGKYEHGWTTLVGLQVGYATTTGPWFDDLLDELPDITGLPARAAHAASRALASLELARRWVMSDLAGEDFTTDVRDLPIADQVATVARIYNKAAKRGLLDRRAKVMQATRLPEKTAQRRINQARIDGLIREDKP